MEYRGPRVSLPLGGIGTGTIGLGARGDLRDWQIANRPAVGFRPPVALLALRAQAAGRAPVTRLLEGPIETCEYAGPFGSPAANHGLPRFEQATFSATYPLASVSLADPAMPLDVRLEAFNPLVPGDLDASSWPVVQLRYRLTNRRPGPVEASLAAAVANPIGSDGSSDDIGGNTNRLRRAFRLTGVTMSAPDLPVGHEAGGEVTLAMTGEDVTHRLDFSSQRWGAGLADFWEDFASDGRLEPRPIVNERPVAALAGTVRLAPGESAEVTVLIAWWLPNRRAWADDDDGSLHRGRYRDDIVSNHYAVQHPDSWRTAVDFSRRSAELERRTAEFARLVAAAPAPAEVREAALSSLAVLRSQTLFRTADGRFFGWEGVGERAGSCFGNCSHVWNYELATAFLFPEISRSFRETQFLHATDSDGLMSFRVALPLERAQTWRLAAADGQLGAIVRLYVDWRLGAGDEWLRRLWPRARRALEFCWIAGGWDADRDGVMEGAQHNTMDVEYYGPNPQMQAWYLAALRAAARMARACGEEGFASECDALESAGSRWMDQELFTGEYYVQQVRVPDGDVAAGLRHPDTAALFDANEPPYQLGEGCLVDQLVGQEIAHLAGLGYLLDPAHVAAAHAAIWARNRRRGERFNPMRAFALGAEDALEMCSYPKGTQPAQPFPYYAEAMTGFEYTAAAGMALEGMWDESRAVVAAVRARHDGVKRNPFDEPECGSHYARSLAAWNVLTAWAGPAALGLPVP